MFKSIAEGIKMLFSKDEDRRTDSYIEVSHPDIEVKVRISEGSSPEEIKEIVDKAIDLSLSRKVELK